MTINIVLLSHEQRDEVTQQCAAFTCRGARHQDDPTTEHGDKYIKEGVWAEADAARVTRTWAAILDGAIVGYLALAADAVSLTKSEKREADLDGSISFGRYGCVQIVMLATHADSQARDDIKVGQALVDHAIYIGREYGSSVGSRFLAADVNPPAQGFYEKCGFVSLAGEGDELKKKRERGMIPMVFDLHPRA